MSRFKKTKLCKKCNTERVLALFTKDRTKKDGLATRCVYCKYGIEPPEEPLKRRIEELEEEVRKLRKTPKNIKAEEFERLKKRYEVARVLWSELFSILRLTENKAEEILNKAFDKIEK